MLRESVGALMRMGPLPPAESAKDEDLEERERLLASVDRPVTDEEALALAKLFGPDDCYGLAWTLLHLIESAPGWPLVEALADPSNEWIARLRARAVRGGRLMKSDTQPAAIQDWKAAIDTMRIIHQHIWDLDDGKLWPRQFPSIAASEEVLSRIEHQMGVLDPDYRRFLKHADGWRGFYQWVDLFGSRELLGSECVEARQLLELSTREGALTVLGVEPTDLLPIAVSTKDRDLFVIVKPERAMAGTVIWLAGGIVDRFPSFSEFFRAMMDYNREEVKDLLKERKSRGLC